MSSAAVSEELARLFTEDQSDRKVPSIDWKEAGPRDAARLARVKQFYQGGALQAGMDFFHAAMILQHSSSAEDHLLAHEFCVVALSHGVEQAKWLAAASEDRFLMNIGRPQRFGTQYQIPKPHGGWSLYEVSTEVEDSLRSALNVPSLFQAQAYADDMNEKARMTDKPITIVLVPLDERPVNTRYPQMLGAIGGAEVLLPPTKMRGLQRVPADVDAVAQWLREAAGSANAAIVFV